MNYVAFNESTRTYMNHTRSRDDHECNYAIYLLKTKCLQKCFSCVRYFVGKVSKYYTVITLDVIHNEQTVIYKIHRVSVIKILTGDQ